jgi:hypothetical protein
MGRIVDEARQGWHAEIAPRPLAPGALGRRVVELMAALAAAAVFFDVVITWALLHHAVAWEENPVVASVMRQIGVAPTLALGGLLRGMIVAGLTFLALWATRRFVRVTAAVVLGAVALWWTAVVFANAVFLGRVGLHG